VCTSRCPLHLPLFDEPLTYHLVDRRFHEAGADSLTVTVTLAVVRNKTGSKAARLTTGVAPLLGLGKSIDVSLTGAQEIWKINFPVFTRFADTQENEVFP
jgi:hypothetical protein